jgi:hypothetical protein
MEVVSLFYRSRNMGIFNLELFVNHGARGKSYIATLSQKEEIVIESLRSEEDLRRVHLGFSSAGARLYRIQGFRKLLPWSKTTIKIHCRQ